MATKPEGNGHGQSARFFRSRKFRRRDLNKQKARTYVAVLFIAADDKILLSPDGDKLTLPARMSTAESPVVISLLCEIFNLFLRGPQGSSGGVYDTVDEDGAAAEYRYAWANVTHSDAESRFLRQSQWYSLADLPELDLSPLAKLAIAQAVTRGAMPDPATYAASYAAAA